MNSKHRRTLDSIFTQPERSNIESLLNGLGATIEEAAGSRISIELNGSVAVFHRPHPSPEASKPLVRSVRNFLILAGVKP